MNKLPDKFTFKFSDWSEYVNIAEKREEGIYDITWDTEHLKGGTVNWDECSSLEIYEFLNEENGWVILEDLDNK